MIRLFHVFMSKGAADAVRQTLSPQPDGTIYIGQGEKVELLEGELQQLLNLPYPPLTTNSCTSALDLALHLIGVGSNDEVISTPITCSATNGVIVNRGARIVWADVDPSTGLIDVEDVGRKITRRTKAIVAVDWGGRLCDYPALKNLGLPVVEDAAHALLATHRGKGAGHVGGDYVCWSFQAIKHLTTGDGGALLPPADELERGRLLRWYGLDRRSSDSFRCAQDIKEPGYKYHMNDISAAIGLANIPHAREIVARHRANAEFYEAALRGRLPRNASLPPPDAGAAWWIYTMLVPDPKSFIAFLGERGIAAGPVHSRNDRHAGFRFYSGPLPGVDSFAGHEVAVPVGWWLSQQDLERVVEVVAEALRGDPPGRSLTMGSSPTKGSTRSAGVSLRPARS